MGKISRGEYELFTTKNDAIDKLMQMQGICRDELCGENKIEFYCTKRGNISITNPPRTNGMTQNSTNLYGKVIEKNGKAFVSYYTSFSHLSFTFKIIFLIINIVFALLAFAYIKSTVGFIVVLFSLAFWIGFFIVDSKDKVNSPTDSIILINELEKRIDAVNKWDK